MGKHAFSLKTIYLAALTAVFAVSFFAFVAFDLYSQQRQTEQAMLEDLRARREEARRMRGEKASDRGKTPKKGRPRKKR